MNKVRNYFTGIRRIGYLLTTMVALVIADAVVTRILVEREMGREINPIMAPLITEPIFLVIKIGGAFLCALILWDIYRRRPRLALTTIWCIVTLYTGIVLWNISQFVINQV